MKFSFGEFLFSPGVLYRTLRSRALGIGGFLCLGCTTWNLVIAGIAIGTQCGKLIVDFGTRQLLLEAGEVCAAHGPST